MAGRPGVSFSFIYLIGFQLELPQTNAVAVGTRGVGLQSGNLLLQRRFVLTRDLDRGLVAAQHTFQLGLDRSIQALALFTQRSQPGVTIQQRCPQGRFLGTGISQPADQLEKQA